MGYSMKMQDIGKAFFGGTGGLFVMETEGQGDVFVNAFGGSVGAGSASGLSDDD